MKTESIDSKINNITNALGPSAPIKVKKISIGKGPSIQGAIIYIDGLVDKNIINRDVLNPLMIEIRNSIALNIDTPSFLCSSYITADCSIVKGNIEEVSKAIKNGNTLLLIESTEDHVIIDTTGGKIRGVSDPTNETSLRGSRDGFVENIEVNISLVRRKIKDSNLSMENFGVPYMAFNKNDLKDTFIRAPLWKMNARPSIISDKNITRQTNFRDKFRRKMNEENRLISSAELFFILVGCILGISITNLPASVVTISKQDGWISTIIGGIYPLYIVLIGGIIIKKYPDSNILNLSKAFFGKIIGNILNILFMLQFLFFVVLVISGASNELRAYSIYFVPHYKMVMILALVSCYASIKGLKVLARFAAITFFLLCLIVVASTVTVKFGSILNVKPFGGAGIPKILEGSIQSAFAYANMELLLIIYPHVQEKKIY